MTDDPDVESAIREEVPGSLPVVVVRATATPEDAACAVAEQLDDA